MRPRIGIVVSFCAVFCSILASESFARQINDHRDPSRSGGAYALDASLVFETKILATTPTVQCETRNLTQNADPVLHVFRIHNGVATEVVRGDDVDGSLNASVRFTRLPLSIGGAYYLLMRAAGPGAAGFADVYCNGSIVQIHAPVGGTFKRLENLRANESLRTLPLPAGPTGHTVYLLDTAGTLLERRESDATQSVVMDLGGTATTARVVLIGGYAGPIRLVRNDARLPNHDPDKDNLGTELEQNIGTCSASSGFIGDFDCATAADARDTDGDGLHDDWELFGVLDRAPFQLLPRWGADPRHKDIFIEVDFGQETIGETPVKMSDEAARRFARIYADIETNPILRLVHARTLLNPDLAPGINMHLDTGRVAPLGTDAITIYGDWGGHNVVAPKCFPCRRADAGEVYMTQMAESRRGIFHYALGDPSDSGAADDGIALNFPMQTGFGGAHEFGHTLGLEHGGATSGPNCKPNYLSIMNYAYEYKTESFSDGYGRSVMNDMHLRERGAVAQPTSREGADYLAQLADVYKYVVDPATGDVDWDRDGIFSDVEVRGAASFGRECEATHTDQFRASRTSVAAPVLTRLTGPTLLFYIDENDHKLRLETATRTLACESSFAHVCGLSSVAINTPWNEGIEAVDAQPISFNGTPALMVVYRTAAGLFYTKMSPQMTWTAPLPITPTVPAVGEISLAGGDSALFLAFKNSNAHPVLMRFSELGWSNEIIASDLQMSAPSSPGIYYATLGDGTRTLYGAFGTGQDGALQLYEWQPPSPVIARGGAAVPNAQQAWKLTAWSASLLKAPVSGKPAITMEPVRQGSPLPGIMHILYMQVRGDAAPVVLHARLVAHRSSIGIGPEFYTSFHDNQWLYANGVDLLYDPKVDAQVRAALSEALSRDGHPLPHYVWLQPKAAGIMSVDFRDFDDWKLLGINTCNYLAPHRSGNDLKCLELPQ